MQPLQRKQTGRSNSSRFHTLGPFGLVQVGEQEPTSLLDLVLDHVPVPEPVMNSLILYLDSCGTILYVDLEETQCFFGPKLPTTRTVPVTSYDINE